MVLSHPLRKRLITPILILASAFAGVFPSAQVYSACTPGANCSAPTPACGQTTTGVDDCGLTCTNTGPSCGYFFNSVFVSQNVPTTMTPGQSYAVSVTLKNTGSPYWTAGQRLSLGSQNTTWGLSRVPIASGDNIRTGDIKTFAFSVTAPINPAIYNFQWRMVQDSPGDGWFGETTPNVAINVTASATTVAPVITSQPANQTVSPGQTATFSVTATGTPTPTYQWLKNGANIPGATAASYTTPATTLTDNGATFSCFILNSAGNATSGLATLTVTILPVITSPLTASGQLGSPFSYTVTALNNPVSFNATGLPAGLTLGPLSGNSATITGTPQSAGTFNITLTATNASGAGPASVMVLRIAAPPAPLAPGAPSNELAAAYAYPVPYKPSAGHTDIIFTGVTAASSVKIYTLAGELVKTLPNTLGGTTITWAAVKNEDGDSVASGVYIFQIKSPNGEKRGKLVIVR